MTFSVDGGRSPTGAELARFGFAWVGTESAWFGEPRAAEPLAWRMFRPGLPITGRYGTHA
jgi:hypothetical protein